MSPSTPSVVLQLPSLEHYPEPGGIPQRIPIAQLPFTIGRNSTAHYVVYSNQVSKEHAIIYRDGDECRIRDLGSTNGTFVNGRRVTDAPLSHGDILHFANKECRFVDQFVSEKDIPSTDTAARSGCLPESVFLGCQHLSELLNLRQAMVVFQPLVLLETRALVGYEALGRGTHPSLSTNPAELFQLAEHCRQAAELSRLFRVLAVEQAAQLPDDLLLFINLHPSELRDGSLLPSLAGIPEKVRRKRLVLEVHEEVVADVPTMRQLHGHLRELEVGMAFDDFGQGQSRITELAEAPPDFAKLDRNLVQAIDRAPARQQLVRALVQVMAGLDVAVIAEGIETEQEARTCQSLGCRYGQGYLFGRPQPLEALLAQGKETREVNRSALRQWIRSRPA
jgi:EAL domain-containing protein (putative c-di-GMP-specific phosphodiesterase class I)